MEQEKQEGGYSLAMEMFAELRRQIARQLMFIYLLLFIIAMLFGFIFYDRWLDSQVEHSIVTESYIDQDNATDLDNISNSIDNDIK